MTDENVVDLEERIPTLKEQRKQRANRRLILYLSVFFLLIVTIVYFQSPLSNIQNVEVVNNEYVDDEWIITESNLLEDVSFWGYDADQVKDILLEHPHLENVDFSRRFPNTIVIDVDEYKRVAYKYDEGNLFVILETGASMSLANQEQNYLIDAPLLVGFDDDDILKQMAKELTQLSPEISVRMSEIHLSSTNHDDHRVYVYMNDGFEVHSTVQDFSERVDVYPSIVSQLSRDDEGIIHMRMNPYFEPLTTEEDKEDESEE